MITEVIAITTNADRSRDTVMNFHRHELRRVSQRSVFASNKQAFGARPGERRTTIEAQTVSHRQAPGAGS